MITGVGQVYVCTMWSVRRSIIESRIRSCSRSGADGGFGSSDEQRSWVVIPVMMRGVGVGVGGGGGGDGDGDGDVDVDVDVGGGGRVPYA